LRPQMQRHAAPQLGQVAPFQQICKGDKDLAEGSYNAPLSPFFPLSFPIPTHWYKFSKEFLECRKILCVHISDKSLRREFFFSKHLKNFYQCIEWDGKCRLKITLLPET
jgi:hypothetical protein